MAAAIAPRGLLRPRISSAEAKVLACLEAVVAISEPFSATFDAALPTWDATFDVTSRAVFTASVPACETNSATVSLRVFKSSRSDCRSVVSIPHSIVLVPASQVVLGWKFWQKKSGYPGDFISFGREKWEKWANWVNWARGSSGWGFSVKAASGFGMGSTGNRAFDEWRTTELARLEEERQKLVAAEREFAEFMENLRHARDREEFERFMDAHRNRQAPSGH